mgnify:CR=1 FL=1
MEKMTSLLRLRMSAKDAHYGGNLVDGAHMVHLFGDVATELLIKCDGDEGLFCAYDMVEFKAPVYAGDYIEAYGEIEKVGNTSRTMKFEARKVIVLGSGPIRIGQRFRCRRSGRAHRGLPRPRHLRDSQGLPAQEDREVRERQDGEADYSCCYLRR